MGETDYGALFGVDMGGDAGTADTAADAGTDVNTDAQGVKEQDVTEPAVDGEGTEAAEGGRVQSPEENARYAAARRKAEAERDAAVLKAREESAAEVKKQVEETISMLGLTNPYTKQPIRTVEDLTAFREGRRQESKNKLMRAAGMSEEQYQQFVADLPEVKAAREQQSAADEAAKKVMENQARAKLTEQMAEITAIDPEIRTVEDLKNMENYDRFYALVKKGNSLSDAYKLVNMDKIMAGNTAASRQAAINAANSKNHLDRTTTRGAGAVTVPRDVVEMYRAFDPKITDAEIQKHYSNYKKK